MVKSTSATLYNFFLDKILYITYKNVPGQLLSFQELLQYAVPFNQHIPSFDDDPRSLYTLRALEHPEIACIKLKLNPQVLIFPDQQTS